MSDEIIKEEEKVEAPAPAPAPVENAVVDKPYDQIIEDARLDFHKSYKNSRLVSNIIMFVVVGAICGVMFLVLSNSQPLKITGYVLAGVLLVGMIVYYMATRKRLPDKTKAYLSLLTKTLNKEMFGNKNFSEIETNPDERLKMDDLVGDGVYSGASEVRSRNVVKGIYKKHHFLYAEVALVRPSSRKEQVPPLFVGKYISIPNNLKFDGRFIFVYKNPKEPLDLPTSVEDLTVLEEKEDFVVYGPAEANYHRVISAKALNYFNKLEVSDHLLNVNVVFWGGHTAVYLSYDDALMSVPVDNPVDKKAYDQSFNDLMNCFDGITVK